MKKNFLWLAGAAVLVACAQTEFEPVPEEVAPASQREIKLDVYQQGITRDVTETTATTLQTLGFQLAIMQGNKFYQQAEKDENGDPITPAPAPYPVTWSGTSWLIKEGDVTPTWPNDDTSTVDFYAWNYSPRGNCFDATSKQIDVSDMENNYDLVVANATGQKFSTSNGNVALAFSHAMTMVDVTLKAPDDGQYYVVEGISVAYERAAYYDFTKSAGQNWVASAAASNMGGPVIYQHYRDVANFDKTNIAATGAASEMLVVGKQATVAGVSFGTGLIIPLGTVTFTVNYKVYREGVETCIADFSSTASKQFQLTGDLQQYTGSKLNITAELPVADAPMGLSLTVGDWPATGTAMNGGTVN